ncbi:hypothetical protein SS50377_24759 [Spironucleus salmonicida]|uniref:Myb-like DNA-binding domain-containing protein n=1 Tax=Spironucleus salmonicida TaxID=348837 RepID=V6LJ52_9EUKA|nr:hypothetical protein SS50377_24759 [Spironucleus salmonicida]|eukprot:EST44640.1 Hypothetical protein SS50377_15647 [Spironucleus salmonicida]
MTEGIQELIELLANSQITDLNVISTVNSSNIINRASKLQQRPRGWTDKQKRNMVIAVQELGYNLQEIQGKYFKEMTLQQLKNQYFYMKKNNLLD